MTTFQSALASARNRSTHAKNGATSIFRLERRAFPRHRSSGAWPEIWGQRGGQCVPRINEESDERGAKNRERSCEDEPQLLPSKSSGCRAARTAISWGASGAHKRSPVLQKLGMYPKMLRKAVGILSAH